MQDATLLSRHHLHGSLLRVGLLQEPLEECFGKGRSPPWTDVPPLPESRHIATLCALHHNTAARRPVAAPAMIVVPVLQ